MDSGKGKLPKPNGHAVPLRDPGGRYLPGHGAPGPGRPPGRTVNEMLLSAARTLAEPLEAARDAVQIARECAPAALLRVVEILNDPAAERSDQLAAARLILDRGYGLPSQAVATLNLDANVMTPEAREQAREAGVAALQRLLALTRERSENASVHPQVSVPESNLLIHNEATDVG
jgi:hypothetical protein